MPNWAKLTSDEKRNLIAEILEKLVQLFPITDDEDYQVFLHCKDAVKENVFSEKHFAALIKIPNGKMYYNIIRDIALHGFVTNQVLDAFEKKYINA